MAGYTEDRCTVCKKLTSPELLARKTVVFTAKADRKKIIKSRVAGWLCEACLNDDHDFNIVQRSGPGHTSPALERVREDRVIE